MIVTTYRTFFFWFTGILVAAALGAVLMFGVNPSADFTGGVQAEVRYAGEEPAAAQIVAMLQNAGIAGAQARESEPGTFIVRMRTLSDEERAAVPQLLTINGEYQSDIESFNEIGPTIGKELRNKAFIALGLVVLAIMLYVAFAFRAVSRPVSSWVYGLIVIVVLLHDVIIPTGLLALLGHFVGVQADALFVVALLTVLGYSVNDTIIVFDRVREKLRDNQERNRREEFELTVGRALNETYGRSINTSLTTTLALLALFFLGPAATQDFALILIAGVIAGTYSSIALAAPLLVTIEKRLSKGK